MTQFDGLPAPLARALTDRGYETLTPVQQAVTDPALGARDALVSAQTGSGKTVAFGIALAETLLDGSDRFERAANPLALIIAPTRELAMQVERELAWLFGETGARIGSCVGGMDMRTQRRMLERGAHIVVGTPGRLRDHIERGSLDLSGLRAAVLDEADEMLDLGFREDLEFILGAAPAERRTLMFSATVSRPIADLAATYQRDALRIATQGEQKQHVDIEYRALVCSPRDREKAIINLLRFYEARAALVFCATRAAVTHLTARLGNRGFSVVALSGELSQAERSHALQALRDGRAQVCIATDVAARGIDLPGLDLVIHADLPQNKEALLHRSGRTGRAGQKGVSAMIVPQNARRKAESLLKYARVSADWGLPPSAGDVAGKDSARMLDSVAANQGEPGDEAAEALLHAFSPAQIASAYVALYSAQRSAPEEIEIIDVGAPAPARAPREDFKNSVWVKLSVGRAQRAEPRWLLPMLCRSGDLTKADIGAIRLGQNESFVELEAGAAERFFDALDDGMLEDSIAATRIEGKPALAGLKEKRPYSAKPRAGSEEGGPAPRYKSRRKEHDPAAVGRFKPKGKGNDDAPASRYKARSAEYEDAGSAGPASKPGKFGKPGKPAAPGKPRKPRSKPASDWAPKFGGTGDAAPSRKPGSKGKAAGKFSSKPAGKQTGKQTGKPTGKPTGKKPRKSPPSG